MTISPENNPENNLNQEKALEEAKQNVAQPQPEPKGEEKPEDPNWRAFREARKLDRIKREEAEKKAAEKEAEAAALKAAMEAAFARSQPSPATSQWQPEEEESEDVRIEKKVKAIIEAREAAAEQERMEREHREFPQRLQQIYPDFNQAITTEALDYLEYHFPEIANPLKRLPDSFEKWNDTYKAVKRFVPNMGVAQKDATKADQNLQKPKSMSSPSVSPTGEPISSARLSEERKAANWERMQRALKSIG